MNGIRIFIVIWIGQLISLLGSGLTKFALGVWVYQKTGSVSLFALISVFSILPGIVISPIAGVFVDRWDRRWAMILSDSGSGICTLIVVLLLVIGRLEIWNIFLLTAMIAAFNSFQWPAYTAATSLLVPKHHLGRASGMTSMAEAVAQLTAPLLASVLLVTIQLRGVILIDFATFVIALFTLLSVRFPSPKITAAEIVSKTPLIRNAVYGWTFIKKRPGLLGLLIFFAINNFLVGIVQVLATPLVLSFTSVVVLGTILSIGGIGMVAGSFLMSAWGGPKRLVSGIFGFEMLGGLAVFIAGFRPSSLLIGLSAFLVFFCLPIINGCTQAIWQRKIDPEIQGRVFAVRRMIAMSSLPLSYIVAGPLADYIFEPLMVESGILAGSLGSIIGIGQGRGIGLMFIIMGALMMASTFVAYNYPRLRMVEDELPDAINGPSY